MKGLGKYRIFYKFKILLMYKVVDMEVKFKGHINLI